MIKLSKLSAALDEFFLGRVRMEAMALCRAVFGFCLFFHYLVLWSKFEMIWGADGVVGDRFHSHIAHADLLARPALQAWRFLHHIGNESLLFGMYVVLLATSLMFALGFWTRSAGWIALIIHSLFLAHNEFAFWGWGDLIRPFMVYTLIAPSGGCYSVDHWLATRRWRPLAPCSGVAWPVRLLQIHVATVYLLAAWIRVDDPNWLDGSMLYGVLTDPMFSRLAGDWRQGMVFLRVACHASWAIELSAPILLWSSKWRPLCVYLLLAFHFSLEVFTMVGYWSYMMMAALMTFLLCVSRGETLATSQKTL